MAVMVDLIQEECLALLREERVGRVALCTPEGPRIVPVNYEVVGKSVVIRTAPYGVLGMYGRSAVLALEVDRLDEDAREAWSVVVRGDGRMVEDVEEIQEIRAASDPEPWPGGGRPMYLRLWWREISGRRLLPGDAF